MRAACSAAGQLRPCCHRAEGGRTKACAAPGDRPAAIDGYASAEQLRWTGKRPLPGLGLRGGDVALKVFRLSGTPGGAGVTRAPAPLTGDIWSELAHPHVLPVADYGEGNDSLYVATQWLNGPSLRAVLDAAPNARRRTGSPASEQLASALERRPRAGLVHLDVKPENVCSRPTARSTRTSGTSAPAGSRPGRPEWATGACRRHPRVRSARADRRRRGRRPDAGVRARLPALRDPHGSDAVCGPLVRGAHARACGRGAAARRERSGGGPRVRDGRSRRGATSAMRPARTSRTRWTRRSHRRLRCAGSRHPAPACPRSARGDRRRVRRVRRSCRRDGGFLAHAGRAPGAPDAAAGKPFSNSAFMASLPKAEPTVKAARKQIRAAPTVTRVSTRKAARPKPHRVAPTSLASVTTGAASTSTRGTSTIASPSPAPASAPRPSSRPETTTTTTAPGLPLPPPPPTAPPPQDSTPPLPPPPP